MEYTLIPAVGADLSPKEIAACMKVLREGGALEYPRRAEHELPQVIAAAILRAGADIVGVGAIKRPRPEYAKPISGVGKSGFSFDPQMHELGYVAVLQAHRGGQSGRIMNSLLDRFPGPLWATTSEGLMKHSLRNRGFEPRGQEWPNREGKLLSLWIRF